MSDYPKEFLDILESVTAKRPRTVIQHILEHGFITKSKMSPACPFDRQAGSAYFFQWELQSPTETLNDGAKPLIEHLQN